MAESDVARIRRCIEQECDAMRLAMQGYAVVGNHDAINHKYDAIGNYQKQLEEIVGAEQAAQILIETYKKTIG